jgi:2-isopropylmalate synthase
MDSYVRIFDTTLRDGEQSPGATMTSAEKLEVARMLQRLGVDVIEAGFPAASPDDLAAVQQIATIVGNSSHGEAVPVICGLARANEKDIRKAWEGVEKAQKPRIHTFIATSDIHMEFKLKMSREQVLAKTKEAVTFACSLCPDVEFSPEDAGRSEPAFLYQVLEVAIAAGAKTLNIPDTVGYTMPEEFGALIAGIVQHVKGIEKAVISVHCHNDLGLATANTLAGIRAGARQAEVTLNGIGERAGNTSLEEVVMGLKTRKAIYGLETGIDTTQLMRASKLVSNYTGILVQPNKAIVGANAFSHEAGIHQDGMLKNELTYEIMRPEMVGAAKTQLVLGKHSGRHALKIRLEELGYSLNDPDLAQIFERFKNLADKKKQVTDADLEALVSDELYQPEEFYTLDGLQVACGTMGLPTCTVKLKGPNQSTHVHAAVGTGPIDATYKAMEAVLQTNCTLQEFSIHAITEGIDAIGEVTVRIQGGEDSEKGLNPQQENPISRTYGGYGADTDIIVASAKAYLAAINKYLAVQKNGGASSKLNGVKNES